MATKTAPQVLIPLAEVAGIVGGSEMGLVERLGEGATWTDWARRPATTPEHAAKLVAEAEAQRTEHEARQAAYDGYLRRRTAERQAAVREAEAKVVPQLKQRQAREAEESGVIWGGGSIDLIASQLTPASMAVLSEVRRDAAQEFDALHPERSFLEFAEVGA